MSRIAQKLWARHVALNGTPIVARKLPDANRPKLTPRQADELERDLADHPECDGRNVRRDIADARATVRPVRAAATPAHDELSPSDLDHTAARYEAEASRLLARANDLRQLAARIRAESED